MCHLQKTGKGFRSSPCLLFILGPCPTISHCLHRLQGIYPRKSSTTDNERHIFSAKKKSKFSLMPKGTLQDTSEGHLPLNTAVHLRPTSPLYPQNCSFSYNPVEGMAAPAIQRQPPGTPTSSYAVKCRIMSALPPLNPPASLHHY